MTGETDNCYFVLWKPLFWNRMQRTYIRTSVICPAGAGQGRAEQGSRGQSR